MYNMLTLHMRREIKYLIININVYLFIRFEMNVKIQSIKDYDNKKTKQNGKV